MPELKEAPHPALDILKENCYTLSMENDNTILNEVYDIAANNLKIKMESIVNSIECNTLDIEENPGNCYYSTMDNAKLAVNLAEVVRTYLSLFPVS